MKRRLSVKGIVCVVICCASIVSCQRAAQKGASNECNVMTVSLGSKTLTSVYSATINGRQSVEIRPQVGGVITKVCIAEGASVRKGESLFIIDQVPYQAALQTAMANVASAQAAVATAQLTADSKQELYKQNVVSIFDMQTAQNTLLVQKAALAQAQAQELNARNNLSYTVVKSPLNGIASMIPYRVGALVNSAITTPLVTVSDNEDVHVYFSMTENQALALSRQGGSTVDLLKSMPQVELRLSDGKMYDHKGRVDAISGVIDQSTGAVSVRATFPNPDKVLRSGGSGNIIFPYQKDNCVVIPQSASYEIQDKVFVYRVIDNKTVSTPIQVFTVNDGKEYVVESGLSEGDVIVADGAGLLQDGMTITTSGQKAVK